MRGLGLGLGLTRQGTGTFTPQLNNLFLSTSTVAENVSSGTTVGALTNTQPGSSYSLIDDAGGRFALSGTNINTATLTDVAVDTYYDIEVEEYNAAYSPDTRVSTISILVTAVAAGVQPDAPTLTLAVGPTTYPPEFDIGLSPDILVGDTVVLEWATDVRFTSIESTASNTIDSGEASAEAATFTGLSGILSGIKYYRAEVQRSGAADSDYSNIVIHGAAEDSTPAAFTFVDQTNVVASTVTESAEVIPSGFNIPVTISVTGGEYAIDAGSGYGSYTSASGTFYPGDKVKARHTSSASPSGATNTVVTIGGVSDTFTTTTATSFADPSDEPTTVHWYDASNETTGVTGTGATLSLRDLIGTHHLTTDSGNAPVTGNATYDVNGLNTIYFDGTKKLWVPAASGIVFPETFHLFYVMYFDGSTSAAKSYLAIGDYSDGDPFIQIGDNGASTVRITNTGAGFAAFNRTSGQPSVGMHIIELWATDGGSISLSINGETAQSVTGYTGFGGVNVSLQLFNRTGAQECSGRAGEVVLCDAVLSGGPRTQMFNYLKAKWATP